MANLLRCTQCGSFAASNVCPHCAGVRLAPTKLGALATVLGSSAFAMTLMACYGAPMSPQLNQIGPHPDPASGDAMDAGSCGPFGCGEAQAGDAGGRDAASVQDAAAQDASLDAAPQDAASQDAAPQDAATHDAAAHDAAAPGSDSGIRGDAGVDGSTGS